MRAAQNLTMANADNTSNLPDVSNDVELNAKQERFIDIMAFSSLEVDVDGRVRLLDMTEIASRVGVTRQTLYNWRKDIPNYAERIRARRYDKFKTQIEDNVWRGLMLRAFKGEKPQAEMVLSHFSDYTPPTQKVDIDTSDNVSDLLNIMRQRKAKPEPQDGEIVNVKQTNDSVYIEAEHVNESTTIQNQPETIQYTAPTVQNYTVPTPPSTLHTEQPMQSNEPSITQAPTFEPPQHNEWA